MLELLVETSQLSAASLMRPPLGGGADDPVLTWHEAFRLMASPERPHMFRAVSFAQLQVCTDAAFPAQPGWEPQLLRYRDALWIRGAGALYDGNSGLALPGGFLSRIPRQRQTPHCKTFKIDLTQPVTAFARFEQALFLPFAHCNNFSDFITETLGFLWPLAAPSASMASGLIGLPAILSGVNAEDSAAQVLHSLLRDRHAFPVLEGDLPEAVHLQEVLVPEPSVRLQAYCSPTHLHTAAAVGDWLIQREQPDISALPAGEKIFITRSVPGPEAPSVNKLTHLETLLEEQGWLIFRPEQHTLAELVAVYRRAEVVAAMEGSALHGLNFLGQPDRPPGVVLLGDQPSPDYFLQFRAQRLPGFFIQCTRPDPTSDRPERLRPRLLNGSVQTLASIVETLAAALR